LEENIKGVENALKLRNLSKTRWTNRAESIRAVWTSYELIINALSAIQNSGDFDNTTKVAAKGLYDKMMSIDFILSIMFMKNIMWKTKQMTEALQEEELNILDAMTIIMATIDSLKRINEESHAMDDEIHAGIAYAGKLGGDPERPEAEFNRKHRVRRPPRRIDDNPDSQATLTMMQFYRREFKSVLETQIVQLGENLIQCFEAVKPLATVLQPPLKHPDFKDVQELVSLFPSNIPVDPFVLYAEFGNFVSHALTHERQTNEKLDTVAKVAKLSEDFKSAFPLTNKAYRLLLTAPVTVAKDERTFSRLKLIKTYLRTSMKEQRLESLMLISCEKDITNTIDIDAIAAKWVELKSRRITFR
jgi:hypothetical protein